MKTQRTNPRRAVRWLSTPVLFGVLLTLILPMTAWAVGTQSGTTISNQATINYDVGGTSQTAIQSDDGAGNGATTFIVDNMVDLTVASQGDVTVNANQTDGVLEFILTNTGNTTQGYALEVVFGPTAIIMNNVEIWIDTDDDGVFDGNPQDTQYTSGSGANAGDLDPNGGDDDVRIFIVGDTPAGAGNGTTDTYRLRATTLDAGTTNVTTATAGADAADTVDVVLADADADGDNNPGPYDDDYNGQHADSAVFTVAAASLSVIKTSTVIEDPYNGTTNPKAIPGAFVEYTITITNGAGMATATSVTITDDLSAMVGGATPLMDFRVDGYAAGQGIRVTAPDINGGAQDELTNISGDDEGDWNATAANTVTVNCGDLDAGESATVTFQLEIN